MKWFNNLRIRVKLISAFIAVAVMAGVVGITGIVNLNKMDDQYSSLYVNYGIAVGDIGKAGIDFHKIRVLTRDVVMQSGDSQEKIKDIQTLDEEMGKYLDYFEKSISSEEVQQNFNALKESISEYGILRDKVLHLAAGGQKEQALDLLYSQNGLILEKANAYFDELFADKQSIGIQKSEENTVSSQNTIRLMVVIVVVAMLLAVSLGLLIARLISNPVKELVTAANRIADGDLNVAVDTRTKDEVGELSAAFRRMSDNLNEVMGNIRSASEQVAAGSKQMSESSITLSQGATEQASSIEELTASIEEISAQTAQNAQSAEQVNTLTQGAMGNAVQGNGQMKEMLLAMEQINESSGSISKIIKVIDEIAFQTNILALNAAVEAARAGQHGKGFAVVAEEVRNLAARSANAAKETTAMIESSIKKVETGTKIAGDTALALELIVNDISKVAVIIEEITAASTEQAAGISQINQGIMQLSQVVQANSATSEENASASEELAGQAELMRTQVDRFTLKEQFRPSYAGMEHLNPEVLQMLDRMARKQQGNGSEGHKDWAEGSGDRPPVTIALSDKEFGKYGL